MAGGLIIERGTSGSACKMAAIDPSQRQRNDFVTRLSLPLPPPCSIHLFVSHFLSSPSFALSLAPLSLSLFHVSWISSSSSLSISLSHSLARSFRPSDVWFTTSFYSR